MFSISSPKFLNILQSQPWFCFFSFQYFFHHRNAVHVGNVISEAYRLWEVTPDDIHPKRMLEEFKPLTKGQYPIFNKYPKFIVDYQVGIFSHVMRNEVSFVKIYNFSIFRNVPQGRFHKACKHKHFLSIDKIGCQRLPT